MTEQMIFRGCLLKNVYDTLKKADNAAQKSSKQSGYRITTYKCKHCGMFHLTKQTKKSKRILNHSMGPVNA